MDEKHLSDEDITNFLFKKDRGNDLVARLNNHLLSCKDCFDTITFMQKTITALSVSTNALPVFILSPSLKLDNKSCYGTIGFTQELQFTPTLSSDIGYKSRKTKVQLNDLVIQYQESLDEIDFSFKAKTAGTVLLYNKNGLILKKKLNSSDEHDYKLHREALVLVWNEHVLYLFFEM